MLYKRLRNLNRPGDWEETHDRLVTPGKSTDWYRWHMASHPLCDMLVLFIEGDVNVNQFQEVYDFSSQNTWAQLLEVYQNFINRNADDTGPATTKQERLNNVARLQAILRAMERNIPPQFVGNEENWFRGKVGITSPD